MKAYQLVADFQVSRTVPCRLTSPEGEVWVVLGLQAFGILFDLPPARLKVAARSGGVVEGWAVERLDPEIVTEVESFWKHPALAERMKVAKAAGRFKRPRS